jgi:hypothetical protein
MDWTDVVQDADQWRGLSNTVKKCLQALEKLNNWWLLEKSSGP